MNVSIDRNSLACAFVGHKPSDFSPSDLNGQDASIRFSLFWEFYLVEDKTGRFERAYSTHNVAVARCSLFASMKFNLRRIMKIRSLFGCSVDLLFENQMPIHLERRERLKKRE